jgi:hypothetical protein
VKTIFTLTNRAGRIRLVNRTQTVKNLLRNLALALIYGSIKREMKSIDFWRKTHENGLLIAAQNTKKIPHASRATLSGADQNISMIITRVLLAF